jgi:hypothetical protein
LLGSPARSGTWTASRPACSALPRSPAHQDIRDSQRRLAPSAGIAPRAVQLNRAALGADRPVRGADRVALDGVLLEQRGPVRHLEPAVVLEDQSEVGDGAARTAAASADSSASRSRTPRFTGRL